MDSEKLVEWLIKEKHMNPRSAKDVLSRHGRVCRILGINELNEDSLSALLQSEQFKESSMFIRSQLKRTVNLCMEFENKLGKV